MVEPQAVEEKRPRFQGPEFGSRRRPRCEDSFKLNLTINSIIYVFILYVYGSVLSKMNFFLCSF